VSGPVTTIKIEERRTLILCRLHLAIQQPSKFIDPPPEFVHTFHYLLR